MALQVINDTLESLTARILVSFNKNVFKHRREVRTRKNDYKDIIFVINNCSIYLFRAVNYSLMFVLCKDALII